MTECPYPIVRTAESDLLATAWGWLFMVANYVEQCRAYSVSERLWSMATVGRDLENFCFCVESVDYNWAFLDDLSNYALCGIGIFLGLALCVAYEFVRDYVRESPIGKDWSSGYIHFLMQFSEQPTMNYNTLRSTFNKAIPIENQKARNHTHPGSAAKRNDGSSFMDMLSAMTGMKAYFMQMSAADSRWQRAGCRTYHWAKDLATKHLAFNPSPSDLLCLVDVDMYMEMSSFLGEWNFQPVCLTTFQPTRVAKSDGEYSFTFDANNNVTYNVSGGATYTHPVWNYGIDVVMAVNTRWGFIHTYNIYHVDRRKVDDHHEIVLLTPTARVVSPFFSLANVLGHHVIQRLKVVEKHGDDLFTRLTVQTSDGLMRCTGKPGTMLSACIPAKDDDSIASMSRNAGKINITTASIKTVLQEVGQADASVLTEFHRLKTVDTPDLVYPVSESVFKYQYNPAAYDPTAKPSLLPFMSPFMLGCFSPDKCLSNDAAAIKGRVTSVKPPESVVVTPKLFKHMTEFAELLIPEPHRGHPVSFETVYEKQNRPSQRMILDRAGLVASTTVENGVDSFVKPEAYGKITDPRIISTIPGVNKNNYSRYVYAFTAVLRATHWYAFALTPLAVAQRVASICYRAICAAFMTDLSRFDGRVSIVLRVLEQMCMIRYFHPQYHAELAELRATQMNQRARTTHGVKYNTDLTRLSGSPETADFNSMDNAFMAYSTLRETTNPVTGQFYTPLEAWEKLGLYGGDDGITADLDPKVYVKVCESVGQVLEIDSVKRGDVGVTFLSRLYGPDVWHGATASMCDVKRQLTKLHTTVSLPASITPIQKLAQKLHSFWLSDKHTPLLGTLAVTFRAAFPHLVPAEDERMRELGSYHTFTDEDNQYPNEPHGSGWMMDLVAKQIPDFDFEKFLNWNEQVIATKSTELMLSPPLFAREPITHVSKEPVVVNGEVVNPPQHKPVPSTVYTTTATKVPEKIKPAMPPFTPGPSDSSSSSKPPRREYTPDDLARMAQIPCTDNLKGQCKKQLKCRFKH